MLLNIQTKENTLFIVFRELRAVWAFTQKPQEKSILWA